MAFYIGSPEGEKLYKIWFKIIQNIWGHHRWQIKVTQIARIAQIGAITDGYNSDLYNVPQRSSSARLLPEGRKK